MEKDAYPLQIKVEIYVQIELSVFFWEVFQLGHGNVVYEFLYVEALRIWPDWGLNLGFLNIYQVLYQLSYLAWGNQQDGLSLSL